MNKRTENTGYGYGRSLDMTALCAYTGFGRAAAKDLAERAGAVIRLGRRVVYDRSRIDAYMDTMTEQAAHETA